MTGPVEWLVGLVLGVDALVIAGLLVSRLSGRSKRKNGAPDEVPTDRLRAYAAPTDGTPTGTALAEAPAVMSEAAAPTAVYAPDLGGSAGPDAVPGYEDLANAPSDVAAAQAGLPEAETLPLDTATDDREAVPPDQEAMPADLEAMPADLEAMPAEPAADGMPSDGNQPVGAATDWDAAVAETPAIPERGPRPIGLDFGPTWVDPVAMAAEAASEWRRGLRRDLALAAWRGRSGLVMNLKLDVENETDLTIADVARFEAQLHQTIGHLVRATDHFDRTGPGRFHVILSEMHESAALAVAERIRHAFTDVAGAPSPRLLIGWAAMETEADVALALERAAERLDGAPSAAAVPDHAAPMPGSEPPNGRIAPEATGAVDEV
jgi:hypothetical protein